MTDPSVRVPVTTVAAVTDPVVRSASLVDRRRGAQYREVV